MPEVALQDMLFFSPAWERLKGRIACDDMAGAPLLLEADGRLIRAGAPAGINRGDARIVWASPDTYVAGQIDAMLDHALEAGTRWLQAGSAGIDNPRFARLQSAGTRLTRSDAMTPSIGELVMASVLDHFQRGPERRATQATRRWTRLPFREIAGTRWLIVGFGAIGHEIARRASAFDVEVTGIRQSGGADPLAERILSPEEMLPALATADVVILCAPLSPATRHLADERFFAAMRSDAVFVNVGRGELVDEPALLAAMDEARIAHAILDVVAREPLPLESPIWDNPRIALTCHIAGLGDGLIGRSDALFIDNLARYRAGRPLRLEVPAW